MSLNSIQTAAVEKLATLRAGALFMNMGTGKTKTALDLASTRTDYFDLIVWIAPASLIADPGYRAEIEARRRGIDVRFFTVESISQSDRLYLDLRSIAETRRAFCVIDESLSIKNSDAKRTARLLSMSSLFVFRLILNGTPVSKGLIDLYAQAQFISPRILNMTESQFANKYLVHKTDGHRPWMRWSKPANERALIETLRPYIFDAELDIPTELRFEARSFQLSSSERQSYDIYKRQVIKDDFERGFLAISNALQAKYTLCESKLSAISGITSGLIFVKFHKEIDALLSLLPSAVEYSGRFKGDTSADLIVMTYGTGAKGLNLQHLNHVIFFSQTFDWSQREHGYHRCYRTGQGRTVTVEDWSVDTGLDYLIAQSIAKKSSIDDVVRNAIANNGEATL